MFQLQSSRIRLIAVLFFFTLAVLLTDFIDSFFPEISGDDWRNLVISAPLITFFVIFGAMTKTIRQVIWQSFVVTTILVLFFTLRIYFNQNLSDEEIFSISNFSTANFLSFFVFVMLYSAGLFLAISIAARVIKIVFSSIVTIRTKRRGTANNNS
ncbi:MAG: hypothetical protein H7Z37_03860 [Pyrinomonadaceae bacterium]|nr:hypothetical protein [Pyrinomonadaceae bacterium]